MNRRLISAAVALIGSAVGLILSAAHTKEDMINLRQKNAEERKHRREEKMQKIYAGLIAYRDTPGAVLLDVREEEDYAAGHIPGAVHAELRTITSIEYPKEQPLFLYCYRGNRSAMAAAMLREAGFTQVQDIGGIDWYNGALEK